jgi:transcriptional regulator with XRE-family HTH domain
MSNDHCLSGLYHVREMLGVRPQELAKAIGVNLNSYYRYENGTRRIQLDKAYLLADRLGVSLTALRRPPTTDQVLAMRNIIDAGAAETARQVGTVVGLGDAWTIDAE